ncbi:MAG: hypothetical protein ABEH59_10575 [Halobacteriales archaeon]
MAEQSTSRAPAAELWPSAKPDRAAQPDAVQITVYIVSGHHGWLTVPESFCRECHLFVRAADTAAERSDVPVNVQVVSWWTRFPWALRHGGYHPPVMVVSGRRLAQGYDVPTPEEVEDAVREAAGG